MDWVVLTRAKSSSPISVNLAAARTIEAGPTSTGIKFDDNHTVFVNETPEEIMSRGSDRSTRS